MEKYEISKKRQQGGLIDLLMFMNVMINTPIYTMLLILICWFSILVYAVLIAKSGIITALWIFYTTFLLFDPSPRHSESRIPLSWTSYLRYFTPYKWYGQYFVSTSLIKTADLGTRNDDNDEKEDESYIFCSHPHGIIGLCTNLTLGTNVCGFQEIFPNIKKRVGVTLNASFLVPIFREWLLMQGYVSANKDTLKQLLQQGTSLILVPGGAMEALHCHPQTFKLYLRKRKGFIKLAMETSKAVVPCLAFGENDIFNTFYTGNDDKEKEKKKEINDNDHKIKNDDLQAEKQPQQQQQQDTTQNKLWSIQQKVMNVLTFSTPMITSIIPNRNIQLSMVVGAPIYFRNNNSDSDKDDDEDCLQKRIDENHQIYINEVIKLYNHHKKYYPAYENIPIEII